MNRRLFALAFCLGAFVTSSANAEQVSWADLIASAGSGSSAKTVAFSGQAWFCEAKTWSGDTDCVLGSKPPRTGVFVALAPDKSAWVQVHTLAAAFGGDFSIPGHRSKIPSGTYGANGEPGDGDYWYIAK